MFRSDDDGTHKRLPRTVDEAVDEIISGLSEDDKALVRGTARDDLIRFHHGWGTGIRNGLGLWGDNTELLASCGSPRMHADTASMVIIKAVWARLQEKS
jgi:hypothetical protein